MTGKIIELLGAHRHPHSQPPPHPTHVQLTAEKIIELLEAHKSYHGLYFYLGGHIAFSESPEVCSPCVLLWWHGTAPLHSPVVNQPRPTILLLTIQTSPHTHTPTNLSRCTTSTSRRRPRRGSSRRWSGPPASPPSTRPNASRPSSWRRAGCCLGEGVHVWRAAQVESGRQRLYFGNATHHAALSTPPSTHSTNRPTCPTRARSSTCATVSTWCPTSRCTCALVLWLVRAALRSTELNKRERLCCVPPGGLPPRFPILLPPFAPLPYLHNICCPSAAAAATRRTCTATLRATCRRSTPRRRHRCGWF